MLFPSFLRSHQQMLPNLTHKIFATKSQDLKFMPIYLKTKRCHVALDHQGAAEILWLQIFVVIDDYQEMTRKQGFMIQEHDSGVLVSSCSSGGQ